MRHATLLARTCLLAAVVGLTACIPPPADIGVDYSGPIYRKPGTDAPRTQSSSLPAQPAGSECATLEEAPTRKRSTCGVREVMARYNGGLQMLYQRRLAENPRLQGQVVLRLNIAADGSVQACDIASSTHNDGELDRQIIAYVRTINFGALENVPAWADTYTLELAPPVAGKR